MSLNFSKSKSKNTSQSSATRTGTDKFQTGWDDLKKSLGPNGLNATQQQGVGMFSAPNQFGAGLETQRLNLNSLMPQYQALANQPNRNAGLVAPTTYTGAQAGQATAGQAGPVADVTARTGASFMNAYRNPYERDVVDSSLADLQRKYEQVVNTSKMGAAAGGAFGGGRHGVADANNADNYLRTVGSTAGNLRNLGFTNAMHGGTADAGRFLSADQGNQAVGAELGMFNAGQLTDTSKFNAGQTTQNNQFNAGNLFTNDTNNANREQNTNQFNITSNNAQDAQKLTALNAMGDNYIQQAGLTSEQAALFRQNAQDLIESGTIGVDQLMQLLRLQTATFGEDRTGSGTGTASGFSAGISPSYTQAPGVGGFSF